MPDTLRRVFRSLPEAVKAPVRSAYAKVAPVLPAQRARNTWLREQYSRFAMGQRENIFLAASRFAHINRPLEGYYFEFGCHGANTMRMAWKHSCHLHQWTFIGFDSFQGLPKISADDEQTIWEEGKLATSEQDFIRQVTEAGMPRERLMTVKGFYDESLNAELSAKLLPAKAAMIYIDCDLYRSTIPVLAFVKGFLQTGTVIVFDDWFCFNGDPLRGEQRAWGEFRERYPDLRFAEFVQTSEAKAFIYLGATPVPE